MANVRGGNNAIAINGSGGAFTAISATQSSGHVIVQEDPSMDPSAGGAGYQGFQYIDKYGNTIPVPVGGKVELGRTASTQGSGQCPNVGMKEQGNVGYQNHIAATVYLQAKSLTTTATKLMVIEED